MNVEQSGREEALSSVVNQQRWANEEDTILDVRIGSVVKIVLELPVLCDDKDIDDQHQIMLPAIDRATDSFTYTATAEGMLVFPSLQIQSIKVILEYQITGTKHGTFDQITTGRRYRGSLTIKLHIIRHLRALLIRITGVGIDAHGYQRSR